VSNRRLQETGKYIRIQITKQKETPLSLIGMNKKQNKINNQQQWVFEK
jgi:hypothetical protein